MKISKIFLQQWAKSVELMEAQQEQVADVQTQVQQKPEEQEQQQKPQVQVQPEPQPDPEVQPQPENPTDYSHLDIRKLYKQILAEIRDGNQEWLQADIDALTNKFIDFAAKWAARNKIDTIKLEYSNFDGKNLNFDFVFKGKDYPFQISANYEKGITKFATLDKLAKDKCFKSFTDKTDDTEVPADREDENYLANLFNEIRKLLNV